MIGLFSRRTALAAFALVSLLGLSTPARAGFVLTIQDVTNSATHTFTFGVSDPDKVDTASGGIERMIISTTVGGVTFDLELGRTNTPGTPSLAFIDQGGRGIINNSSSAIDLRISLTSTGFTAPTAPPALVLGSTLTANVVSGVVSNATFNSYIGTTNTEFEQSIGAPIVGPLTATGSSGVQSGSASLLVPSLTGPYSLTNILNARLSGNANVTELAGNTTLANSVPEPSSIVAMAAGLPFLTLALRRRKASK